MNLHHSIFVPISCGIISLCKHSESITHHKNSFRINKLPHNKLANLGYIICSPRKNLVNSYFLSSQNDSSSSHDHLGSESTATDKNGIDLESTNKSNRNEGNQIEINEDLSNLISVNSQMVKKGLNKEDIRKYDWFDDDPVDSSDEELMVEYYESKLPDFNTLYKNLDPVGLKNYVPDTSNSNVFLGRVYEVGESLLDDAKLLNTHSYQEIVDKSTKSKIEYIKKHFDVDKCNTHEEAFEEISRLKQKYNDLMDEKYSSKSLEKSETEKIESTVNSNTQLTEQDKHQHNHEERPRILKNSEEDEYIENYKGVNEFDFGKEFEHDSEDVALEDDMCRFFLEIPLRNWVKDEIRAYESSLEKIEKARKYYTKPESEPFVTDIRTIFKESPMTTLGIFDNDEQVDLDEDISTKTDKEAKNIRADDAEYSEDEFMDKYTIPKENVKELYVKEYKHSDLLNDIDKYQKSKYPQVVESMSERDANKPVFVLDPERTGYKHLDGENITKNMLEGKLRVYVGVPKNFIKFDEINSVTINDSVAFRRNYDICIGKVIESIPLQDEYHTATVILPNQAGYMDQNIRYLADELAVNTKGLVFVPDIPVIEEEDWYFTCLNRLLKLIQTVYKVDRVSLVGLGDQGHLLMNYVNKSMEKTINQYQSLYSRRKEGSNEESAKGEANDSSPDTENNNYLKSLKKKNKDAFDDLLETFAGKRADDLIGRQSVPLLDDILDGLQNIKLSQSHKTAMKAKDSNIIKPVSKLVQSIVLYDTCNIDFEKLISLSVPAVVIQSNRTKLIDEVISSETESFLKIKDKKLYQRMFQGINMFEHAVSGIPDKLKSLINRETTFKFIPSAHSLKRNSEQYYITSFHRGIDIMVYVFKNASPHFYMKKPKSPKLEYKAFKDSIACCAKWILCWSY